MAVAAHAKVANARVGSIWALPEDASVDNALNFTSVLSLPGHVMPLWVTKTLSPWLKFFSVVLGLSADLIMPGGGANPPGALGHVGAVLELCEQIRAGAARQPRKIFLPLGSGCTSSGLIVGIALARTLGLGFEGDLDGYEIHAVAIHQALAALPILPRTLAKKLVGETADLVRTLGGPDVRDEAKRVFKRFILHTEHAGRYGAPTKASRSAKALWQSNVSISQQTRGAAEKIPAPWLCDTFSSKGAAVLHDHFIKAVQRAEEGGTGTRRVDAGDVLFWSTKSLVQPLGELSHDERLGDMPQASRTWLADCFIGEGNDRVGVTSAVDALHLFQRV